MGREHRDRPLPDPTMGRLGDIGAASAFSQYAGTVPPQYQENLVAKRDKDGCVVRENFLRLEQRLRDLLDMADSRLSPLMRAQPEPAPGLHKNIDEMAPMFLDLQRMGDNMHHMISRIEALFERIEV